MTAKADVLRSLDHSWNELHAVIESMSEAEMLEPGVVEDWSVKDLLGHIAFWANRAANTLTEVQAGRGDQVPGTESQAETDEWNAREAAARKGKSLTELREEFERAHQAARSALEAFPQEKLDEPFKERTVVFSVGADTFAHYQEHASQIKAWLRQMETTEA
jgi:uncharacterized protein (TIGR03083 family)